MFTKIFILFILPFSLWAEVDQFNATQLKKNEYKLDDVCKEMGFKHILFAEMIDEYTIDCMGKKLLAKDFCHAKFPKSGDLLRAYIEEKNLVCLRGEDLHLTINCVGAHERLCNDADRDCLFLKDTFAIDLKVIHASIFPDEKKLSCSFSKFSR